MPVASTAIAILLISFFVLLILKVPVTFSLALSSVLTALYYQVPLMTIILKMVKGIESSSLMAIPFFIVAGEIMGAGGISRRLIELANVMVGRVRGGMAQVNILASMFFGGISGSAVADVSSIGAILIPMMKDNGYDDDYSVAVTVTSSCQGVIIPPSHNMIIYSLAAGGGVSVGRLFLGGMLPGVILGVGLMILSYIIAVKRGYPKGDKIPFKEKVKITMNAFFGLMTAVIIMGGVLSGVFTATESAAVACLYAFVITFFVYREIPLKRMGNILYNALKTLALVLSLIAAAKAFGHMLALLQVPALATNALLTITQNKTLLLLLILVLILLLGCIMDMAPLILILTPILLPVVTSLGMDPVQFGVVLILALAIGLCTPPVGSALFVGCAIGKVSIEKMTKSLLPFYGIMVAVLLLITFVPGIVMFIPNLFL
ncbi:TRAP transporter large permease [Petrocella sp. FN5]|uniref:TRAP transporter large permease n=1 Tax=Petrocella sp. FN5 TaxID=3032002 RepID=UPI0023DC88B1|nr:TRAP transporter large permease [Petrocella sp. FN5]MDF1617288.1 TRAP transporter large permease [Petrocella sp. FN5]